MSDDPKTTLIAIYGAIVATFSLAWNVYQWWVDRGKLTVRCMIGLPVNSGYLPIERLPGSAAHALDSAVLIYRVTNVGSRSITVRILGGTHINWDGWLPKWSQFSVLDGVPSILEPSDYFVAKYDEFLSLGRITELAAIDSSDKRYKAPPKDVRRVRCAISQLRRTAAS